MSRSALILCTRNRTHEVYRLLASLIQLEYVPKEFVIVEASDSQERLDSELLKSYFPGVTLISSKPGLTHQRNQGLRLLSNMCEVVHFVDDDVVVQSEYFRAAERLLTSSDSVVGVGVRTLDNPCYGPRRTRFLRKIFLLDSGVTGRVLRSGINTPFYGSDESMTVEWLSGCLMTFRAAEVRACGFDESRTGVGWGEDVDFSLRIRRFGELRCLGDERVLHLQSAANRDPAEWRRSLEIQSRTKLAQDHPDQVRLWAVKWALFGEALLKAIVPVSYAFVAAVRELMGAIGHLFKTLKHLAATTVHLVGAPVSVLRSLPQRKRNYATALTFKRPAEGEITVGDNLGFVTDGDMDHANLGFARNSSRAGFVSPDNCVAVELNGGLGNQLFGVAVGILVASRQRSQVVLDPHNYETANSRRCEVAQLFSPDAEVLPSPYGLPVFQERSIGYDPDVLELRAPVRLRGYFQSYRYVEAVLPRMRHLINTNFKDSSEEVGEDFIGLQVRRGDYLQPPHNSFHGIVADQYFINAVEEIRSELGDLPVIVFSDDSAHATDLSARIENSSAHEPKSNNPMGTLLTLGSARALVISNSSFGWWAAMLAQVAEIVIAPERWYLDDSTNPDDLIPPSWRRRNGFLQLGVT